MRAGVSRRGEVVAIVAQLARALTKAHERGIVHRDIKPSNVFLCDAGGGDLFVKLLDFGIAKGPEVGIVGSTTRTGSFIGSPFYMSPEQVVGAKAIDFRTDLWSLGVVAFEALTGEKPFYAETVGGPRAEDSPRPDPGSHQGLAVPAVGNRRMVPASVCPRVGGPLRVGQGDGRGARALDRRRRLARAPCRRRTEPGHPGARRHPPGIAGCFHARLGRRRTLGDGRGRRVARERAPPRSGAREMARPLGHRRGRHRDRIHRSSRDDWLWSRRPLRLRRSRRPIPGGGRHPRSRPRASPDARGLSRASARARAGSHGPGRAGPRTPSRLRGSHPPSSFDGGPFGDPCSHARSHSSFSFCFRASIGSRVSRQR